MARRFLWHTHCAASAAILFFLFTSAAWAVDIDGVQPAALDQPQVNLLLRRTETGAPLSASFGDLGSTISIQAYLDTGSSGILLSKDTADGVPGLFDGLGVVHYVYGGTPVTYTDVGVGGNQEFDVSETLYGGLAPFQPDVNVEDQAAYTQSFGPMRTQISQTNADSPTLALDVVGMPALVGKVVVMDPKPVDAAIVDILSAGSMNTYVYNPGTPYTPADAANPGIPTTNRHIKLSYGDFSRFTTLSPMGAEGPTLHSNPFIGPNPVAALDASPPADNTPGVTVSLGGLSATGSFLFDTGAGASTISNKIAADLHIRYTPGTEGTANAQLEVLDLGTGLYTPVPDQFQLTVSGVGGNKTAAGFYLDSLLLPTVEGRRGKPRRSQ